MVYQFKGKNRLSYAGAKFAAIQLGNIHVKESSVNYNKDLDQFEASALAYNGNINLTLPGYAEQTRLMKIWDNKEKNESHLELDEFARRKAASKAVRNALMAVMPADHIAAYMRAAIDGGRTRVIKNVEVEQVPVKERPRAKVGPPPRREEPKPEKKVQLSLGRIDANVIAYNLRAVGIYVEKGDVSIVEEDDGFYVEPSKGMTDDDFKRINGTLVSMGAEWQADNQYWVFWKEAEG